MNKDYNKRGAKRINCPCKAKVSFSDKDRDISVTIKDITLSGARVIIGGRMPKVNAPLEIKLYINKKLIQCKGRVAWVLAMRLGAGNISVFDVGIKFTEMNSEGRDFLEKLSGR